MLKFILKGTIGTVDIIELHGALAEKGTIEIRDKLLERLKQGITDVVFLCENFKQVDSIGISLFIEISDHLQTRGGKLHFVECPLPIMIPMKSLGMINFFQFYKTEQEAMQALKITHDEVGKVLTKKTVKSSVQTQMKRQVAIKDHVRNKMILFKHFETALMKDVVSYLQSTYAHFRDREIELTFRGKRIPQQTNLEQLFVECGYNTQEMLEIEDVTPEPPNFKEMVRRGGKLFDQAILEVLVRQGVLENDLAKSVKQISDLNQERVLTTLLEGDYVVESKLLQSIGAFFQWETADVTNLNVGKVLLEQIGRQKAFDHGVLPLRQEGQKIFVAMENPLDASLCQALRDATGKDIEPVFAPGFSIRRKLEEATFTAAPKIEDKLPQMPKVEANDSKLASGYFSVENLQSPHFRAIQEYSQEEAFPDLLEDFLPALRRVEQRWKLLQKFAQQARACTGIDAVLEAMLDMIVTTIPIEHGLFLLDEEGDGELRLHKFAALHEYQSMSEQQFSVVSSPSLISQVKKSGNIAAARNDKEQTIHVAVPFISQRGKLLGLLYMISPSEQGLYDLAGLKPSVALFSWGTTIIENQILINRIKKMEKRQ